MEIDFSSQQVTPGVIVFPEWTYEGLPKAPSDMEENPVVGGSAGNSISITGSV